MIASFLKAHEEAGEAVGSKMARRGMLRAVLAVTFCLNIVPLTVVDSATCSFLAIYAFGDSMIDVGNSISAFPVQYAYAETGPNGHFWPQHAADRMCDGKLLVDFMSYGSSLGPTYPFLRSTATNPEWGTNFASAGSTAVNQTTRWTPFSGFNAPFSLNYQLQWLRRYKVRLSMYYQQTYVTQSLPAYSSLNTSIYMVQAGFQDYFFPLYDKTASTKILIKKVPEVVSAIGHLLEGLAEFGAQKVLVVNLLPLGCLPALLTTYPSKPNKYNEFGCLTELNKVSIAHNIALSEKVTAMRAKYPNVTYYLGDYYSVYNDVLRNPKPYNVTETLKACCGAGGSYNFNKEVTCSNVGTVGNQLVNLTTACNNTREYLNWDGIHPSHTANRAAASNFFSGKFITPGSLGCTANTSRWDTHI